MDKSVCLNFRHKSVSPHGAWSEKEQFFAYSNAFRKRTGTRVPEEQGRSVHVFFLTVGEEHPRPCSYKRPRQGVHLVTRFNRYEEIAAAVIHLIGPSKLAKMYVSNIPWGEEIVKCSPCAFYGARHASIKFKSSGKRALIK